MTQNKLARTGWVLMSRGENAMGMTELHAPTPGPACDGEIERVLQRKDREGKHVLLPTRLQCGTFPEAAETRWSAAASTVSRTFAVHAVARPSHVRGTMESI